MFQEHLVQSHDGAQAKRRATSHEVYINASGRGYHHVQLFKINASNSFLHPIMSQQNMKRYFTGVLKYPREPQYTVKSPSTLAAATNPEADGKTRAATNDTPVTHNTHVNPTPDKLFFGQANLDQSEPYITAAHDSARLSLGDEVDPDHTTYPPIKRGPCREPPQLCATARYVKGFWEEYCWVIPTHQLIGLCCLLSILRAEGYHLPPTAFDAFVLNFAQWESHDREAAAAVEAQRGGRQIPSYHVWFEDLWRKSGPEWPAGTVLDLQALENVGQEHPLHLVMIDESLTMIPANSCGYSPDPTQPGADVGWSPIPRVRRANRGRGRRGTLPGR